MSAILSANDLNDFISPGVACVKPVETLPAARFDSEYNLDEVTIENRISTSDLQPAQISLTDCLACSGCVTSAEAVLISLQSHSEVLHALDSAPSVKLSDYPGASGNSPSEHQDEGRIYVASVSPQSRASIAATYGVSERVAGHMIEQLLRGPQGLRSGGAYNNGFEWVVDTNTVREMILVLGAEEVLASLNIQSGVSKTTEDGATSRKPITPILTSSCPGWICYAEKTHPYVLPHLSRLKSPQALMGTLLKTTLSRKLGISPDRIWHVTVMPCFDKKLEASREELTDVFWEENSTIKRGVRDVDCVITSKELVMLADSRGIDFGTMPRTPLPASSSCQFPDVLLQALLFPQSRRTKSDPATGTSGGNLYYILRYFLSQCPGSSIQTSQGRNADVVEYTVTSESGESLFKAARYYGFRNIQNLVRRLKPARPSRVPGGRPTGSARKTSGNSSGSDYAYVEVMACPGGCTNGGGQIKLDDPIFSGRANDIKPESKNQKHWLAMVDEAYFSSEEVCPDNDFEMNMNDRDDMVDGISPSYIKETLDHWSATTGLDLERLVRTSYRVVISSVGKSEINDTQRVVELAGKIGGGW